jgi:serine protease Do
MDPGWCVATEDRLSVEFADGRQTMGRVVARDPQNDLAAIRVELSDLPAASFGDSRKLRVGDLVIAVGHPLGIRDNASLGIVSGVGTALRRGRYLSDVLQADIQLAPGNSGGPLLDASGRVVGIASMIVSPGIAIAVPTHVIRKFVQEVIGHRTDATLMAA